MTTAATNAAGPLEIDLPPPGSDAWQPLLLRGVPRPTVYTRESLDGVAAVRAESHCGASGLILAANEIDLNATPILSWRWRVDRGLEITDETVKAGDDFAARVYAMFELDAASVSVFARLRHRVARAIYGPTTPGSALTFVWTGQIKPDTVWDSPFTASSKMISLVRGEQKGWRREREDIVRRYRELFDRTPPDLMGIAIMSDSDNSCQETIAYFANFRFTSREKPSGARGDSR